MLSFFIKISMTCFAMLPLALRRITFFIFLETCCFLQVFWITCPLYGNFCCCVVDLTQIIKGKLNSCRAQVFFKSIEFCSTWNWYDPRLLGQQPSKCNLCRSRILFFCNFFKQVDHNLIRLSRIGCKTWHDVSKIVAVELRVFINLSGKKASPQRTEWNESYSQFFKGR